MRDSHIPFLAGLDHLLYQSCPGFCGLPGFELRGLGIDRVLRVIGLGVGGAWTSMNGLRDERWGQVRKLVRRNHNLWSGLWMKGMEMMVEMGLR